MKFDWLVSGRLSSNKGRVHARGSWKERRPFPSCPWFLARVLKSSLRPPRPLQLFPLTFCLFCNFNYSLWKTVLNFHGNSRVRTCICVSFSSFVSGNWARQRQNKLCTFAFNKSVKIQCYSVKRKLRKAPPWHFDMSTEEYMKTQQD